MDRLTLIREAKALAADWIDGVAAINDASYAEYMAMGEERAVNEAALDFLREAVAEFEEERADD